jgi:large subunit ribosomal protein L9
MDLILTKEVLGLGDPGDLVTVKNGYGRNYLIPQGMALEATKKNVTFLEAERKRIAAKHASEADKVRQEADKLSGVQVTVTARAGETGKLYGSVTNMDLAAALAELGHDIDRRRIMLEAPIKQLGAYPVKIKLHAQVIVEIQAIVESESGEAEAAAQAAEAQAAPAEAEAAPESEEEVAPAEQEAEAAVAKETSE